MPVASEPGEAPPPPPEMTIGVVVPAPAKIPEYPPPLDPLYPPEAKPPAPPPPY